MFNSFGTRLSYVRRQDLSRFLQSTFSMLLFRFLPLRLARAYLGWQGFLYFLLNTSKKEGIHRAQVLALGHTRSSSEINFLCSKTISGMIDHYFEKFFLALKSLKQINKMTRCRIKAQGLELLDQALTQHRGVILVTGHFGAVEFMPCALAAWGYPVTILCHCKTKALKERMENLAAKIGVRLLDPKDGQVFFSMLRELAQGRVLITQCDEMEAWRPYNDRQIDFLGLKMKLDRTLDVLVKKAKAPILFALNHRRSHGKYLLAIDDPLTHAAAREMDRISAKCLTLLGSYIYSAPEAWYEWSKIETLESASEIRNENNQLISLSGQMAFQPASTT
ncbi:MAG: lysophospholipid acyltransferase family protein [Deltaproteobacteria bacterium]|nr:lysophospholipid acyltransferase family protein [Deltaproteobacteria bacterium]